MRAAFETPLRYKEDSGRWRLKTPPDTREEESQMRGIRKLVLALTVALAAVPFAAAPASAVVCHEEPGSCCGDVKVLGKTIVTIYC